jgi:hypothetical protein
LADTEATPSSVATVVDRVLGDVQVYPTVGGEVWADVALVVSLNFITGQPVEE